MAGFIGPIRSCDRECALVNHCTVGGERCERCGCYFCSSDLNEDHLCADCEEEVVKEIGEDDDEND